ncbi:MAG: DUF4384 domain-containing protein [Deltaproteobacteria bacterium]|nr:DUF4384 domain-containing protein [Deltaproteobacteria bacterium]
MRLLVRKQLGNRGNQSAMELPLELFLPGICRPQRTRLVSVLLILLFCLAAAGARAGFWGTPAEEVTLDELVAELSQTLVKQVDLTTRPVLVGSSDFFDAHSGLSLPLAVQLRGRFISELKKRGARILLPGSDEDQYLILQGSWQREGEFLALDMKVMAQGGDGPEAVAAASGKLLQSRIDARALVADLDSWGRYLLRKLEGKLKDRKRRTLYLRPVKIKGGLRQEPDLALYVDDWLRPAMADSSLFRVLDPQNDLKDLAVPELKRRGLNRNRGLKPEFNEAGDLTADLLQADGELWSSVWKNREQLEIRASLLALDGTQLSAATVAIPTSLFPGTLIAAAVEKESPEKLEKAVPAAATGGLSQGGLRVELSSNRGDLRPRYSRGEQVRFLVRLNRAAWVYLIYLHPDGSALLLYPLDHQHQPDAAAPALQADRLLVLPDDGCPYSLKVSAPYGQDQVLAIAAEERLALPPSDDQLWQQSKKLLEQLRQAGLTSEKGYAEARLELVTLEN